MTEKNDMEKVWELEYQVIKMVDELGAPMPPQTSVMRNVYGTLHVNLCALRKIADLRVRELERRYGFVGPKQQSGV